MRSAQLTTSPSGVAGAGQRPRVVADAVEGLGAEVERRQHDVGAPDGVVVAVGEVGVEGVLGGVAARTVAAVVAEGDGLGERDVEPQRPGDGGGDLGDLEGVGEAGALVVVGEDEDLGLAGEAPEGGGTVQDAVAVALEARAHRIGLLGEVAVPGTDRPRGPGGELQVLHGLPLGAQQRRDRTERRARLAMGLAGGGLVAEALHRRRPGAGAGGQLGHEPILSSPCDKRSMLEAGCW